MSVENIRNKVLEEISVSFMGIEQKEIDELVKRVLEAKRIFLYGERREDIPIKGFCMRLSHLGLTAFHLGDVCTPNMNAGDLLIVSCASGSSGVGAVYMKTARQTGVGVVLLTDTIGNVEYEMADDVIMIPVPDVGGEAPSIQPRGALYEQVLWLTLDYAELLLQSFVGGDEQQRVGRHANIL